MRYRLAALILAFVVTVAVTASLTLLGTLYHHQRQEIAYLQSYASSYNQNNIEELERVRKELATLRQRVSWAGGEPIIAMVPGDEVPYEEK